MHVEPVLPNFEYVKIRRSGGIMGVDQTLVVDKSLAAQVKCRHDGDRAFSLDAFSSQELMTALSNLAERKPDASDRKGYDLFQYDIELAWNGKTFHVSSVDLGADEALHGVMLAANRLMHPGAEDTPHIMELHTEPAAT